MSTRPSAKKKYWLLKVPNHLLAQWNSRGVGDTLATATQNADRSYTLTSAAAPAATSSSAADQVAAPAATYSFSLSKPPYHLYPLQTSADSKLMPIVGEVSQQGVLRESGGLSASARRRFAEHSEVTRMRRELQPLRGDPIKRGLKSTVEIRKEKAAIREKLADKRKDRQERVETAPRLSDGEVENLVLQMFEQRRYWHKNELGNELNVDDKQLMRALGKLCEKVTAAKHGQEVVQRHQHEWALKSEYAGLFSGPG